MVKQLQMNTAGDAGGMAAGAGGGKERRAEAPPAAKVARVGRSELRERPGEVRQNRGSWKSPPRKERMFRMSEKQPSSEPKQKHRRGNPQVSSTQNRGSWKSPPRKERMFRMSEKQPSSEPKQKHRRGNPQVSSTQMEMETCKLELPAQNNLSKFERTSTMSTGEASSSCGMLTRANMKQKHGSGRSPPPPERVMFGKQKQKEVQETHPIKKKS
ncbi:uncharacterized protein [Triticum aestivum]|uniref:uncharacterized protein isoform X3 n=2 Tax=Triticum aestivum TaxID=4565 RepID=UPI001D02EF28|nr:uncharacterized protein LOC123121966 isoform X3 [Triticum aestivum]